MPEAPAASAVEAPSSSPSTTATPVNSPDPGAWRSGLSSEYQSNRSFEKFTDVNGLAKSYLEMEKMASAPKLPMPQPNWGEREWGDFYSKAGRPEKPEGYEFQALENLPPGLTASPETDKWFADNAFKLGLSKAQAKELRDGFVNYQAEQAKGSVAQLEAANKAKEEGLQKLQAQYGPKWNAAVDGAQKVVGQYASPEFKDLMKSTGLDSHPAVLDFMAKIGGVLHDHSVITGIPRGGSFRTSPAAAQSELNRMNNDPVTAKILTDSHHPQHDAMMKQREALYKTAYSS